MTLYYDWTPITLFTTKILTAGQPSWGRQDLPFTMYQKEHRAWKDLTRRGGEGT